MDNACVIGYGVVGQATDHAFSIGRWFDKKGSNITLEEAAQQRYIFICLPTELRGGRYNTDDIFGIIKQIRDYAAGQNVFIIRSTVSPGTCRAFMDRLDISWIVHVPEFLTEATAEQDAQHPDIVVIGADDHVFRDDVEALYRGRYQRSVDIFTTDTITAELAKCAINAFYATKVIFANEIFDYAQKIDANYEKVKDIMYARKWIGKNHLRIFDENGKRGAGGKCLPKDLEELATRTDSKLLKVVKEINAQKI